MNQVFSVIGKSLDVSGIFGNDLAGGSAACPRLACLNYYLREYAKIKSKPNLKNHQDSYWPA